MRACCRGLRQRVLGGLLALAVVGCGRAPDAPPITPSADSLGIPAAFAERLATAGVGVEVLDRDGEAYALVRAGDVLLQWVDVRDVAPSQILGPLDTTAAIPDGHFHPDATSASFEAIPPGTVTRQQAADPRLLAVLNGAFFETPGRASTQIAFPIAENGRVVTGGSSPNGPGRPGSEGERWDQPLRVLALAGDSAQVADLDLETGAPLAEGDFSEAVASYAPDAHPTRVAARYHVLGVVDPDSTGASPWLLIATSDGLSPIDAPSDLLARLGADASGQIALDGGASVYLWNRRAGTLHRPSPAGGNNPQHLPHFLTLRRR
ncbi:MAG: hypothetical protein AAGK21_15650 [Bacteroidota bacterium]